MPSRASHVLELDNPLRPLTHQEGIEIARSDERPASFWYEAGMDFVKKKDWRAAHGAFAKAVAINPGFKNVKKMLQKAEKKTASK